MPRHPPRCGTASGYRAHYQREEKPCEECRAARAQERDQPYKPIRYCACGRQIKSETHDTCWMCRERPNKPKPAAHVAEVPAEIEWVKDKHGIWRHASVREPGEFSTWAPRAAPKWAPQWEQVNG